jgi:hypothetical protein
MPTVNSAPPEKPLSGFVAYPSSPSSIGQTIIAAVGSLRSDSSAPQLIPWEENDIAGRFIVESIISEIDQGDILLADITRLNFNVIFEIGYAIGRKKRVVLVQNKTITSSAETAREVGIFDTLGYKQYGTSGELANLIRAVKDIRPLPFDSSQINSLAPVYLLAPRIKSDFEVRINSRIKKARLQFRTFDPEEHGRLAAGEAIDNVAESHGVVIPLLSKERVEASVHNFRAAFVAGLAFAQEKALLLLQESDDPVPIDYRDLVSSVRFPDQINDYVGDFSNDVAARFQSSSAAVTKEPKTFLSRLNLGASSAENEFSDLGHYYLVTDEYRRALSGEVRVVTGRKGAGKTALFAQLRDKLRQNKALVVLDLRPEGFQLIKLKERVLDYLSDGAHEHTITAFWEYLLLLETCHKILEKDKALHMRDNRLYSPYRTLAETYYTDEYILEGDFAERMLQLMDRVAEDFEALYPDSSKRSRLSTGEITNLLHKHDVSKLRDLLVDYLGYKDGLWILFDNLDKGWPPHGVTSEDVLTVRCLIEAMAKIENQLRKRKIESHGIVFIRNDVYELLVENTPDRGKVSSITLDWTDPDLLRELLRKRFLYTDADLKGNPPFDEIWRQIAATHIQGEETSQYLIDRSLMRPRALIELLRFCRSHAVNLERQRIEVLDIEQGEEAYSSELLTNLSFEIRDIIPSAEGILYEFVEAQEIMSGEDVMRILVQATDEIRGGKLLDILLWYGFLGVIRDTGDTSYIYSVKYDIKRLNALVAKRGVSNCRFRINPAFWRALEIKH